MKKFYSNLRKYKGKYIMFIGRWCPFHRGHEWLIKNQLEFKKLPVLILIRDTDEEFTAEERGEIIKEWMKFHKVKGTIGIIPDIEGVYYGRGVGYSVEEIPTPMDVKVISATELRKRIENNDSVWEDLVPNITIGKLRNIIKKKSHT